MKLMENGSRESQDGDRMKWIQSIKIFWKSKLFDSCLKFLASICSIMGYNAGYNRHKLEEDDMRARHRLEFDLFLKRRKARLATAAAIAAAAEEAAAAQQSHHHHSPGQTQYYTLPAIHPGTAAAAHLMGHYGGAASGRTAFLPTAAALGLHMQQQAAAAAAAAASRAYVTGASTVTEHLQQHMTSNHPNHQQGSSIGHGFTLPLNTSSFQQHLQNIKNFRGPDGQGSSLTPSPTVSPTPALPPSASPLPHGEQSLQHSTNPSSSGTITAAPSISGASQLSAQSPEFSVSGSIKGGQGSTPDTPTRAPLIPHPQMGIPGNFEAAYAGFAAPSPYATIRAPSAVFGQPGAVAGAGYSNPAYQTAPGYYLPPGYIG